jgi:hypothetical protein
MPDEVYVLLYTTPQAGDRVISVHASFQGAAEKMADYTPDQQSQMEILTRPIEDDDG